MQEITTLTALVMRRARDLIADYGWPDHTDVDQRDPVNKPGWISIYVRLDAANIVHLLPLLCTGDVPAELQSAMTKIAGTPAQIILSGSRYADAPQLPEDGTQIAFPWAGEWLTEPEIQAVTDCLSRAVRGIPAGMGGCAPDKGGTEHARGNAVLSPDPKLPSGCEGK